MRIRRMPWQDDSAALTCRQLGPVLQAYIDDEAHELDVDLIREHLEACRDCGLEHETYLQIKASLARHSSAVPTDVTARLLAFTDTLSETADNT